MKLLSSFFFCEEKSVVMCAHMCVRSSEHWLSLLACFLPPSLCFLSVSFFLSLLLLSLSSAEQHYIAGLFQVFAYKIIPWHSQHLTRIYCFHVTDGKYWAVPGRQVAAESWLGANPSTVLMSFKLETIQVTSIYLLFWFYFVHIFIEYDMDTVKHWNIKYLAQWAY